MPSRYILITWEADSFDDPHVIEEVITVKCIQASRYLTHSLEDHCPVPVSISQGVGPEDWNSHYVIFNNQGWMIEHSLQCRMSGKMLSCISNQWITGLALEPLPALIGKWKIVPQNEDFYLEPVIS